MLLATEAVDNIESYRVASFSEPKEAFLFRLIMLEKFVSLRCG